MISPALGTLVLLATLGVVAVSLATMTLALIRARRPLFRVGATLCVTTVAGYAVVWLAGLILTPARLVPTGEELAFCGLDCHLHVAAVRSSRGTDLAVTVRFRSDARRAAEYPGLLRLVVVDGAGRRYAPSAGMIAEPLEAGQMIEREFRFSVPASAGPARLEVSYDSVMDYLVPGLGNPLAQRRTPLALGGG